MDNDSTEAAPDENGGQWTQLVNIEDVPHVNELYNLIGVSIDLKFAAECFDNLKTCLEGQDQTDHTPANAYFSAGAIAYSRCFGTGVRGGLDPVLLDTLEQSSPGAARSVHDYIRNMRDKHIAHSISPFEFVMVGGMADFSDPQNPQVAVGFMTGVGFPFGSELAHTCRELARNLYNAVLKQIEATEALVRQALLDGGPEYLINRPGMSYVVPGTDQAGIPRRFGRGIAP
ncbi:hypothetical protein QLG13_00635 [Rhodococcus aetherivorans]|uniref:hypothetical protein n=1 Tax=Rhodococcus aetherivorans TaxID=191292 RepID=UPI0012DFC206|nr:hypothetical protein [Rhodococcus aetherivorans]